MIVLFTLIFTGNAYAYLDPGSGSYMLQLLVGALAAGAFVIKQYWRRIKRYFLSTFGRKGKD